MNKPAGSMIKFQYNTLALMMSFTTAHSEIPNNSYHNSNSCNILNPVQNILESRKRRVNDTQQTK